MKNISLILLIIICFCFAGNAQWVPISSAGYTSKFDAIHFIDSQNGYCSGFAQRKTTDGGNTWTTTSSQGFRFL